MSSLTSYDSDEILIRLNAILESAIDGIITIDSQGIIELVNPSAAKIFGYSKEELIGKNISFLMPEPFKGSHDQYMANYHKTGIAHIIGIGREVPGLKKDGTIFPFRLSVGKVSLPDRTLYTGTIHDITDQKKAEEKLQKLNTDLEIIVTERTEELAEAVNKLLGTNKKLESEIIERKTVEAALKNSENDLKKALEQEQELSELKSRFVSMASHEFRTPLSTILSSASLIGKYVREVENSKRLKHVNRIKSAISHLNGILNDFLSLAKLEEGKIDQKKEIFDFEALCEEVNDEINSLLKDGQSIIHAVEGEQTRVNLDKRMIKQIMFNLLSNSSKYSDAGRAIFCNIRIVESQLTIKIKDQGIGISVDDQKHIFTRFFRAKNALNISGTGLGLNIVRRYVVLMGGTIGFISKLGKGTEFTVEIPYTL